MISEEITYADKVGLALLEMKENDELIISQRVKPENKELFISTVKSYIDKSFLNNEGFEIIFSNDYSKVIKLRYITLKK